MHRIPVPTAPAPPPAGGTVLVSTAADFIAALAAVCGPTVTVEPYRPTWWQRTAGRTGWAR